MVREKGRGEREGEEREEDVPLIFVNDDGNARMNSENVVRLSSRSIS